LKHIDCPEGYMKGNAKTIYIRVQRKRWVKIGYYCTGCGDVTLLPEYDLKVRKKEKKK